jgi:hypothetical protein
MTDDNYCKVWPFALIGRKFALICKRCTLDSFPPRIVTDESDT